MKLCELRDNPGARKNRMRVGRGEGSGVGKTSGRGQKGQKGRTGVSLNGFEGGQNPLYRRLPKRGFDNSMFQSDIAEVSLGKIQGAIDAKKIDPSAPITETVLKSAGLVKTRAEGVKLLSGGSFTAKVTLEVYKASKGAAALIESQKGTLTQLCQA